MAKTSAATKRNLPRDDGPAESSLREAVLESLLQLHVDFRDLGRITDAGPLLHALMEMAYHAETPGASKRPSTIALN